MTDTSPLICWPAREASALCVLLMEPANTERLAIVTDLPMDQCAAMLWRMEARGLVKRLSCSWDVGDISAAEQVVRDAPDERNLSDAIPKRDHSDMPERMVAVLRTLHKGLRRKHEVLLATHHRWNKRQIERALLRLAREGLIKARGYEWHIIDPAKARQIVASADERSAA